MARNLVQLLLTFTQVWTKVLRSYKGQGIGKALPGVVHVRHHENVHGPRLHSLEAFGFSCHT